MDNALQLLLPGTFVIPTALSRAAILTDRFYTMIRDLPRGIVRISGVLPPFNHRA